MNAPTKLRSPFSTDPIVLSDGEKLVINRPTKADDAIFEVLARFDGLTVPYIAALAEISQGHLHRRLRELRAEPNCWIKISDTQSENRKRHWNDEKVFELTDRAKIYLKDKSVFVNDAEFTGSFDHKLMSAQVRSDFDYGAAQKKNVAIISFQEMLADPRLPHHTKKLEKPHLFEVTIQPDGKRPIKRSVRFDCNPFIVEREKLPKPHLLILGIEIDRASEPVKTLDYFRSSIRRKLIEQITLFEQGTVRDRFGFPTAFIIYVSSSKTRLANIMEMLDHETTGKPSFRRFFLFITHKDATDNPIPTGDMLTKDYQRVGYESFNLLS